MKTTIAIAAATATAFALAGCATTPQTAAEASKSAKAANAANAQPKEEQELITGSRIPNRPPRDRMVKQVEGSSYAREQMNSTSASPDPQ